MRVFYDCEFLEDGRTIELISIGMVAEDGRELYLVNRDAPWKRIKKDEWLMANVVSQLPKPHGDWILHMPKKWLIDFHNPAVQDRDVIATAVAQFLQTTPDLELWADYGAYDHVVLCQLFGRMIDLPSGVPMFTNDLQQEVRRLGNPALPEQPAGLHNALGDARHLKVCFEAISRIDQLADLQGCDAQHPGGAWRCEGVRGHDGDHRALHWYERWRPSTAEAKS